MRTKEEIKDHITYLKQQKDILAGLIEHCSKSIIESEKELEELNKPKRFKPEYGEIYFAVGFDGVVYENEWFNRDSDWHRYKTRNCFKTKEEAEEELERILFINEVRDFIEKENGGWFFDDNGNENGFLISIENDILSITEWRFGYRHSSISKYFKSKEIGEKILAKFDNQKLIKWFL